MAGILTGILTTATDHIIGHTAAITGVMIRTGLGAAITTRITIITIIITTIIIRIITIMRTLVVMVASTTAIAVL
jgi:hypothetical protein